MQGTKAPLVECQTHLHVTHPVFAHYVLVYLNQFGSIVPATDWII